MRSCCTLELCQWLDIEKKLLAVAEHLTISAHRLSDLTPSRKIDLSHVLTPLVRRMNAVLESRGML
jgi:hypothetical protein